MDVKITDITSRAKIALRSVLELIKLKWVHVYRNLRDTPYVFCDHPQLPAIHATLDSSIFAQWLTHFVYSEQQVLLANCDISKVVAELSGRALANRVHCITDAEILRVMETEPVVATVLEFMHTKTSHECQMESFLIELQNFAAPRKLLVIGRKHFPRGANILSRKLNEFKEVFKGLGIDVKIERKNGSIVTLTNTSDDTNSASSATSSNPKLNNNNTLLSKDDRVARLTKYRSNTSS